MKKKISIILSLAMTLGIMSGVVGATDELSSYSTADENGIYTISPQNCISEVVPEGETSKWTHNEKYYRLNDNTWTDGEYSLTFGFDFTGDENIGHDVWILTTPNPDHLSGKSVTVGNNEATNIKASFDGWNNRSVSSYKVNVLGSDFSVYWTKVSANTFFEKGQNTLKYTALKRNIGNEVEAVFGGALIVPSYYNWEPVKGNYIADEGKSVVDTGSAFPYAWIELENYDTATSKDVVRNSNASGGALLEASGINGKASFTYTFKLDEEGTYDIWYLGTDLGVTHLSKFDWGIDAGETDELTASKKLSATSSVYKKPNGGDFAVMWQKTAENIEIGTGVHTLLFEQKTREIENNRWGVADAIVIVPSGLEWQPETVCGDSVKATLDIAALGSFYENKYADPVSENIYMPKMGPAGSRYAYVSADEEIISNDGTIYPSETEELMGAIIVTATKGDAVSEETPVYIVLEKTGKDEPEIPDEPEAPAGEAPVEVVEDITVENPVYVLTPDDVISTTGKNWTSSDEIYRADVTYTADTVPEYSLTFGFNHTGDDETGYDIWVLTTIDANNTTSRPYIKLDANEEVKIENSFRGWNNLSVSPYKNNLKGTDFKVYWCKASENILLSKGEHTVKYRIGKSAVANQKWILGVNGGMFIVPSSYNWTPTKANKLSNAAESLNIETKFAAPYAWVEAEKYKASVATDTKGRNYTSYTEVASGSGVIDASGYQGTAEFVYDFSLNGTGKYDIWYLGTDLAVDHLSKFSWSIDDSEPVNSKKLSETTSVYKKFTNGDFSVMWQKAAEKVEIEGGAHTLTILHKTQTGSTVRWGLIDCFVIVPSSLGWEPGAEISDALKANLDASAHAAALNNKYTKGTDTNLYLAQYGAAGSRFSYVSADETLIKNSGVINPAEFEDKEAQITVTATKGETSVDKVFTAVVLMSSDIKVKNFMLQNGSGEVLTNLTAGDTIKASASVLDTREIKTGALMIIALYNADGSLNDSFIGKLDKMTDEYQEVSASLTLPSDVTGMTVKAFLWDNTTDMYPIRECISNVR